MAGKKYVAKRIDGRSKNGGPRPNSGTKLSAVTLASRRMANELVERGESPLDLIHENMMFWWKASTKMGHQLMSMIVAFEEDPASVDNQQRRDATDLLRDFMQAREKAQQCAVDAAPYFHPRLQSIAFKGKLDVDVKAILDGMTPQQAAEAYAASLK